MPAYDGTETYLLDGQALTPIAPPTGAPAGGDAYFARRVEGRFDWIQRVGSTPSTYTWVITDKSGTQAFYGESTARLSDPSVTNGNIFRWSLSRVRDVFKNEMKVRYEQENFTTPADPSPRRRSIPSRSTTRDAAYRPGGRVRRRLRARRHRRSGVQSARPDDHGRPGFQEATRCLLKQIKFRLGGQLIRRYDLVYNGPSPSSAEKTQLKAIEVRGTDGTTLFYKHQFQYYGIPVELSGLHADKVHIFQPPVAWGDLKKADGTPRLADGLNRTKDKSRSLEGHIGAGVPGFGSISLGITDTGSGSSVSWDTRDLNGDGMPDGVGNDGLYDESQLMSGADLTKVARSAASSPESKPTTSRG